MPKKSKPTAYGWTLVQHSAYGYKGDGTFRNAVETCMLRTKEEHDRVVREGGLVIQSYLEASDREYNENYPKEMDTGVLTLTPRAQGSFSAHKISGLSIYVPKKVKA